jgi:hypothetical protein
MSKVSLRWRLNHYFPSKRTKPAMWRALLGYLVRKCCWHFAFHKGSLLDVSQ